MDQILVALSVPRNVCRVSFAYRDVTIVLALEVIRTNSKASDTWPLLSKMGKSALTNRLYEPMESMSVSQL